MCRHMNICMGVRIGVEWSFWWRSFGIQIIWWIGEMGCEWIWHWSCWLIYTLYVKLYGCMYGIHWSKRVCIYLLLAGWTGLCVCRCMSIYVCVSINEWTCVWRDFFDELYLEFRWWNEFVKWVVKDSDIEAFDHFRIVHVIMWLDACVYACLFLLMCVCTCAQQIVREWSWWYQFWETVNFSFL